MYMYMYLVFGIAAESLLGNGVMPQNFKQKEFFREPQLYEDQIGIGVTKTVRILFSDLCKYFC